ncbi:hypothetical protein ACFRJ9_11295 [Paenarthrobacter sp. NPDC056912]|uniref:hypothetical protein n=1 Tax=Paenarthrobacter sp. NPDC056912 TaxID=3345965 RepID=UPI00366D5E3D
MDELLWDAGTFLGIEHPQEEHPWGTQTVPFRPNDMLGLVQGFGAGAVELIDGVWSYTGTEDDIKRQRAFAAGAANAAALGTLAGTPFSAWDESRRQRDAADVKNAQDLLGSLGPAFIHADQADTNPNWAAGATIFNAVGVVGSPGAGAAVKSGALASKAGSVAERLSVSTVQSTRLGNLSALLGTTANGLNTAGVFLAKPGSLTLKVADILMPNTTAKVIDTMAQSRAATWAAITDAKTTATQTITGTKHATADALGTLAHGLRAAEISIPATLTPDPNGALTRTGFHTGIPDKLDTTAATIRANNPPAFVPPTTNKTGLPTLAGPAVVPEHFVRPNTIVNTVKITHGDLLFPVSRGDNFAARTGLEPHTEYIIDHRTTMKDTTGGHTAITLEKFYTDQTGTVTIVDTYAGVKGAWSIELNKPMPNVTYNVIAEVDGGLQNTFTLVMDNNAHLATAKGHITSTLIGDSNRNGWQQVKTGRLGGPGYDGGHAAPSALGFIGERSGLFPHHEWQNRKTGTPNEINESNNFHDTEMEVINRVKGKITEGKPIDLTWDMTLKRSTNSAVPSSIELQHFFGSEDPVVVRFNNLKISK